MNLDDDTPTVLRTHPRHRSDTDPIEHRLGDRTHTTGRVIPEGGGDFGCIGGGEHRSLRGGPVLRHRLANEILQRLHRR